MSEILNCVFANDTVGNITAYDIKSGTIVMTYKSGVLNQHSLCLLNNDFILAAEKGPLIHAWLINSREKLQATRMVCPGPILTMAASPDSSFLAVSIDQKLLIWQISSGKLCRTVCGHFQSITVTRWSKDGSYIITGGDDGLVCVWKFSELVVNTNISASNINHDGHVDAKYTFSDHSVKITDLYVGTGGSRARLFTVSMDKTCKIYDLCTGFQLLSVVFDDRLTAITVDLMEVDVFVASADGVIKTFCLLDPPRTREYHYKNMNKNLPFVGHCKMINYLQCTVDGDALVSASQDETIKIWHIFSRQCVRTIQMKGPVTCMSLQLLSRNVFSRDFRSNIVLRSFQKCYDNSNTDTIEIITSEDLFFDHLPEYLDDTTELRNNRQLFNNKLIRAKIINKQLYEFAVENVLMKKNQNHSQKSQISETSHEPMKREITKPLKLQKKVQKRRNKRKRSDSRRSIIVINHNSDDD